MSTATPRVLILGGGFGGVGAAQKLKDADAEIVLVDRHDYHTFQPLLYQLATGLLEQTAVGHSIRDLVERQKNTSVHKAAVTGIDLDAKEASFAEISPIHRWLKPGPSGPFQSSPGARQIRHIEPSSVVRKRRITPRESK